MVITEGIVGREDLFEVRENLTQVTQHYSGVPGKHLLPSEIR